MNEKEFTEEVKKFANKTMKGIEMLNEFMKLNDYDRRTAFAITSFYAAYICVQYKQNLNEYLDGCSRSYLAAKQISEQ